MADIELIIKIDEKIYQHYKKIWQKRRGSIPESCIAFGVPLPKGHGRLLDEKDILDIEKNDGLIYDLVDMPDYIADIRAIIEADKSVESEERSNKE